MPGQLADGWARSRRKLVKSLPRAGRDRYEAMVTGLLALAESGRPTAGPDDEARDRGLLQVGIATATALAQHTPDDLELLAAAAVLPWFDDALLGSRARLLAAPGPPDWTTVLLLAMAPAAPRSTMDTDGDRTRYLRHLAALPPLPRAAVLLERYIAAGTPEVSRLAFAAARAFDETELARLAPGIPPALLPLPGPPAPPDPPPGPAAGRCARWPGSRGRASRGRRRPGRPA